MAVPKVFISSTYYDLKQVRNNIGDFIRSLGYETVMHEKSEVAYTQSNSLEFDCYNELSSCDIVVCIIGNHFGSKSEINELSITMNELEEAIKNKKKIYIFIANDVYIENKTFLLNKENINFQSAYTDDIKIHLFIEKLKSSVKDHVIESFENTAQIINTLRKQFAGLLQNFLQKEASLTDTKTAYDIQESADGIKRALEDFEYMKDEFFKKFDATIFTTNYALTTIRRYLGLNNAPFYAKDINALDEFMQVLGFEIKINEDCMRKYIRIFHSKQQTLLVGNELFDINGKLLDIREKSIIESNIRWEETEQSSDTDLPF